jgi:hypothetical protein
VPVIRTGAAVVIATSTVERDEEFGGISGRGAGPGVQLLCMYIECSRVSSMIPHYAREQKYANFALYSDSIDTDCTFAHDTRLWRKIPL